MRLMTETTETTPAETGSGTTGTTGSERLREITRREWQVISVVGLGAGLLGLIGFANSFGRVRSAAVPSFGDLAWTVPLGIDLGIAVFSALDIVLARLDMRPRWLRLIPWSLTAATIWLNVAGEFTKRPVDWFAVVAHTVLPGLWVIVTAVGAHAVRVRVGLARPTYMDRIRRSRWLLAPLTTVSLWQVRSYPKALDRERARVLALAELQEAYGPLVWRWKAPRRVRALYRLGELVPEALLPAETAPDETAAPSPETGAAARSWSQGTTRRGTTAEPEVVPLGDRSETAALKWLRKKYRDQPVPGLNKACAALREAGLGMRRETVRDRLLTQLAAEREASTASDDDLSDRAQEG
jgi:hypothetical protein